MNRRDLPFCAALSPTRYEDGTTETARSREPLDAHALLEAIEVRRLFEPVAAALAASRITENQLAEVAAQINAMAAARDNVATFSKLDVAFHRAVSFVTGNSAVTRLLTSVSTRTALARMPHGVFDQDVADTVVAEHAAIHAALASRDPALAQAAVLIHVDTTEKWLRRCLTAPRPRRSGTAQDQDRGGWNARR